MADIATEVAKEIAKNVYDDAGKSVVKPTGELLGLVPRAIKAALSSLEKWVLQKEYNVAATKKLLEEKLKDIPPELIEAPEPHIAVPAMQYISYCMDNEELREMYANLLAKSMNKVVRNGVHPGFVEIIKQLSPDEAKILRYFSAHKSVPTIIMRVENERHEGIDFVKNFSDIGEKCGCEDKYNLNKYFDNLIRLGLIDSASTLSSLIDKTKYEPLKTHPVMMQYKKAIENRPAPYNKVEFCESYLYLSDFGEAFCGVCLENENIKEAGIAQK